MPFPELKPWLSYQQTIAVEESLTVPAIATAFTGFAEMPPVLATAFLVGFIEWSCVVALGPFLTLDLRTVGVLRST